MVHVIKCKIRTKRCNLWKPFNYSCIVCYINHVIQELRKNKKKISSIKNKYITILKSLKSIFLNDILYMYIYIWIKYT